MSRDPILELGEYAGTPSGDAPQPPAPRRLRALCEPALFVVGGVAALLFAVLLSGEDDRKIADTTATPSATASTYPALVVQSTASAGETITVVAHRRRASCGSTMLTFDGHRVAYRRVQVVRSPHPEWSMLVVTFDIPATAARGGHRVTLHGPAGCGPSGPTDLTSRGISVGP